MFTKTTKFFAIIAIVTSVLFLSACSHNDDDMSKQEKVSASDLAISDPQVKKEIEFMRNEKIITEELYQIWLKSPRGAVLDESDIMIDKQGTLRHDQMYRIYTPLSQKDLKEHIMTDEIMIDRKMIQDQMKNSPVSPSARMKRYPNMFASAGGTITCRVFTQSGNGYTAVTQAWKTALVAATNKWNSQGLKVKFNVVDATNTNIVGGYVNVYMADAINPNVYASGWTPGTSGYFGERLRINLIPGYIADVNGKVKALVHELGHIVGFMHTDAIADSNNINTAITCNESNNANSFMFSQMNQNDVFTDFSSCDKQNLTYYWGY